MSDLIGRTLGAYRITEQIGAGGMATVFKAYHAAMDRYVAIKTLPRHLATDASFRTRFEREARTIARLEHRHILPVYDVGVDDDIHYLVMRYTDAGTLSDAIARDDLPLPRAVALTAQVGEALGYAHRQGVIHRDIKPANVLIGRDGDALLSDFGIARIYADNLNLTGDGMMVGTPYYMAPEQVRGQPADARSDLYALGVVLYEAVTGRRPFVAETPLAVALMHLHDALPPPRSLNPQVPEAVERIILKALSKLPEDRYQTADAMVEALRAALVQLSNQPNHPPAATVVLPAIAPGPPPQPATVTAPPPAAPAARRSSLVPLVVGGLLILALIGGALAFFGGDRGSRVDVATETTAAALPTIASDVLANGGPLSQPAASAAGVPLTDAAVFTFGAPVRALAADGTGVWASTAGGLVRWLPNGTTRLFTTADGLPFNDLRAMVAAADGTLYVANFDRVVRLRFAPGENVADLVEAQLLGRALGLVLDVSSLHIGADGALWASANYGDLRVQRFDGTRWQTALPLDDPALAAVSLDIRALYHDAAGQTWLGLDGGVVRYDGSSWTVYDAARGGEQPFYFFHLAQDATLWAGTDSGVLRYDSGTDGWQRVEPFGADGAVRGLTNLPDGGLLAVGYTSLARSADGGSSWLPETLPDQLRPGEDGFVTAAASADALWLARDSGGVTLRVDGRWQQNAAYGTTAATAFGQFVTDSKANLYAVAQGGGAVIKIDALASLPAPNPAFDGRYTALAFDGDAIYAASRDDGSIVRLDGAQPQEWLAAAQLPNTDIRALLVAENQLWVGTAAGLLTIDLTTKQITVVIELKDTIVSQLIVADDDAIWAGGHRENEIGYGVVARFADQIWQTWLLGELPNVADPVEVYALVASDYRVVLATGFAGGVYEYVDDAWRVVNDDAYSSDVLALAFRDDLLVAAGNTGTTLAVFEDDAWRYIELGAISGRVEALAFDSEGTLWIATSDGLVRTDIK